MNNHTEEQLLRKMIEFLAQEAGESLEVEGKTVEELKAKWRGLVNIRQPKVAPAEYVTLENEYLKEYHAPRVQTLADCLSTTNDQIKLYYGDLCELKIDAIVNAANSEMLGCFIPNHRCIDNAIHTFSGIQLRSFCHHLMEEQGRKEPVGKAKITPAFNLPSKYIIHTVGPFLPPGQKVTPLREQLLAGCYKSCLEAAREVGLSTIAFCGISTGEFGFPKEPAARIAVDTVNKWLQDMSSTMTVVFSTYTKEDQSIYQKLLSGEQ
ncbi:protein-ADP-ribose hydrolase [Granulicatella adiacens]|jgi:appr-1-p processing enzyme family domain protein|uniref:protein-ADP-ribose hydrolase n=1 Tax=Granulicatella adiacens TaxID=46124 RepID=UPI001C3DF863|nr:protein-ADP-ribose hydrolase [Granulicatella adiacens]